MIHVLLRLLSRRLLRQPPPSFRVVALLLAILAYGATGFLYFELPRNPQLTWTDGLWWSFVTMTTVGYGDLYPTTPGGRFVIAVPLMFFGIGLLGYVLSLSASALVAAKSKELHGMVKLKLKDHLVIFNYPHLAKVLRLLDELEHESKFGGAIDVALIDEDLAELPPELADRRVRFVRGNPTRDETLDRACIDGARYAIVLSKKASDPSTDALNVAIALAIEARARSVKTVVECVDFGTQELLRKAGCDSVVCTSRFDAHFLSHELLNPGMQDVFDELTTGLHGQQIFMTAIELPAAVPFALVARVCQERGHLALGVRRGATRSLNVGGDFEVRPGDQVISIGARRMAPLREP
ncbi:ion channel [Sorangium sp. So ce1036]|uniref:potassium channel family protein n=1 Tax=Sorangium sp. So ce1036 TaxID=3133328 RepID=UPI003F044E29